MDAREACFGITCMLASCSSNGCVNPNDIPRAEHPAKHRSPCHVHRHGLSIELCRCTPSCCILWSQRRPCLPVGTKI
jgi:hypothetical protein